MKKSHGIECRSATQEHDTTEFFYCTENKHGQNPIWFICRSATQKIDTITALFYCTKHGQNQTHHTDTQVSVSL
jgi:hypothetical protein